MARFSFLTDKQKKLIANKDILTKSQKYRLRASVKRKIQWYILGGLTILILIFYTISSYDLFGRIESQQQIINTNTNTNSNQRSRTLLTNYGAFTKKQVNDGAWFLYFVGMLYTFVGIALVCDEFFVPAIEIIVEKTHMSPDTAGATWMAAGGSAPELFTSLIGTILLESDVGFGTIVGSAVFNVLFVIGCCAIFTPGDLRLTWWPFARDSLYYTMCLTILAIFFGIATRFEIWWYEALILLSLYAGYVTLMKQNKRLHHWFHKKFLKKDPNAKPRRNTLTYEPKPGGGIIEPPSKEEGEGGNNNNSNKTETEKDKEGGKNSNNNNNNNNNNSNSNEMQDVDLGVDTALDKSKSKSKSHSPPAAGGIAGAAAIGVNADIGDDEEISISVSGTLTAYDQPRSGKPIEFHVSLFDFMTKDNNLTETAGVHMVARIRGEVKDTFNYIDANGDNNIDLNELKTVLAELGESISDQDAIQVFNEIDEDNNGLISFAEFQKWYLQSAQVMRQDVRRLFKKFDVNDDDHIDATELKNLLTVVNDNKEPTSDDLLAAMRELDKQKSGKFTEDQFVEWWENSRFFDAKQELRQRTLQLIEDEDEEGIDLSFPESLRARIMYCITAPIMYSLYYTMPDVQKEEKQKYWYWTFILSIFWLGGLTYVMVWFAVVVGKALGIPDEVMGLTFLAAGTSVPDLLTSVIVARHGEADMAVSSSIGSNIFDILIGLPFPWLIYVIINPNKGGKITVEAKSLFFSLILLVIMLLCVLLIIKMNGWKMTHTLGYAMFGLYVIFVIQDLLRQMTNTLDFLNF